MAKRLVAGVVLLGSALLAPLAQAAGELPAAIKSAGVLHLSINATYPPMEYVDEATSNYMGLDIDIVNTLATRLGLRVERSDGLFKELIPALTTGRSDFLLSGITDTPERREAFDFVDYMKAGAQFYVVDDSPIKQAIELCGQKVGTIRSTTYPGLIQAWSDKNCVAAGKPPIEIVGSDSSPDVRVQMKLGRTVAGVQGGETIPFTAQKEGTKLRILDATLVTSYYGAAFRKSDTAFRDFVAGELQKMIDDGTYAKIFAHWNLTTHAIPAILINNQPIQK